jgi:hypothetical protein
VLLGFGVVRLVGAAFGLASVVLTLDSDRQGLTGWTWRLLPLCRVPCVPCVVCCVQGAACKVLRAACKVGC